MTLNLLYVCSRNQWRRPTGERLWQGGDGLSTRSAGTSRNARRPLTLVDIRWADLILAMEEKHKSRIAAEFRSEIRCKAVHVLDIPDEYRFMEPELTELPRTALEPLIRRALAQP